MLLGLGGILIAFLFFSFQDKKLLLRYLELQLLVFISMQTIHLLMHLLPDKPVTYGDGPTQKIIDSRMIVTFTKLQVVLLALVFIFVLLMEKVKQRSNTCSLEADSSKRSITENSRDGKRSMNSTMPGTERKVLNIIRLLVFSLIILATAGLLSYVLLNSLGRLPEKYLSTSRILKVDNNFEGGRGRFWSFALTCYKDICNTYPWCRYLGVGPNCTYVLFAGEHAEEMQQIGQQSVGNSEALLANAHSEWLTEFIDEGILGGIAYCGIFISVMASCARRVIQAGKDTIWDYLPVLTAASAFGYFCHDTVSYQQISAAPFMFVILGLGMQNARCYQDA